MIIDIHEDEQSEPRRALARLAPELAIPMFNYSFSAYRHSRLSLRELEAARIRTAEINGCLICRSFRAGRDLEAEMTAAGMDAGKSVVNNGPKPDEALYANILNWREASNYAPRERLAIELAERIGLDPGPLPLDKGFWSNMRALFSDAEITDLTLCIGAWIAGGRILHVLGLDTVCAADAAGEELLAASR